MNLIKKVTDFCEINSNNSLSFNFKESINRSPEIEIPPDLKARLIEFHSKNSDWYKQKFGSQVDKWFIN